MPVHSDAVQAFGQLPVDFAASGLDAMTVTAHKLGGPVGVGALVAAGSWWSNPCCTAAARSATCAPARSTPRWSPAFAAAADSRHRDPARAQAVRLAELRDDLVDACSRPCRTPCSTAIPAAAGRLPGNAHFSFPGCEGDALLLLLDARGIECSTGSACSAGVARPSHVLLAMGADEATRVARCASPSVTPRRRPTSTPWSRRWPGASSGPGGAGLDRDAAMKVLAAMSGGVDSAVAAARAVDAGHDVTGVHLALSSNPSSFRSGARGCCTLEDSRDARRAADVLGIPFYVWDLAERFREDVIDDFVAEYEAGRTPNPCLRCNEKIKFTAVLDKAVALGFDAVCTGHYARIRATDELHRAVDPAKDQSYVLGVLTTEQLARAMFPLGDIAKAARARRGRTARPRGRRQAGQPRHLLRRRRRHRGLPARQLGDAPGDIVDASGAVLGPHDGAYAFTVGQRRGLRIGTPAPDGRPRYVLDISPVTRTVTVGSAAELAVGRLVGVQPRWCGPVPVGPVECLAQVRAHGSAVPAVAELAQSGSGVEVRVELRTPIAGVAPGQAVVLYDGDRVIGSATIDRTATG